MDPTANDRARFAVEYEWIGLKGSIVGKYDRIAYMYLGWSSNTFINHIPKQDGKNWWISIDAGL